MAQIRSDTANVSIHTPLFDRFASADAASLHDLARDVAEILGGRRVISGSAPGVLAWGLDGIGGFSPGSEEDRGRLAAQIVAVVEKFEPRLEGVRVTPIDSGGEFRFNLEANLTQVAGRSIRLRILTPRRGGSLGADVVVVGDSG